MKILILTTEQKKNLFLKFILTKQFLGPNNPVWFAKVDNVAMHFYPNGKLMIQGEETQILLFLKKHPFLSSIKTVSLNQNSLNKNLLKKVAIPYFGGDESGVGDLFGPIVITVVYLDDFLLKAVAKLPIKDSKELSDQKIRELAPKIMKYEKNFNFVIVKNEIFNKQFSYLMNLKELITFYYVKTLKNFLPSYSSAPIIIDGYTNQRLFKKYCVNLKLPHYDVELVEKAENKYLAVAMASIISRFLFLQEIDKISNHLKQKVLLGAGLKVQQFIQDLQTDYRWEDLKPFLKINYKGITKKDKSL